MNMVDAARREVENMAPEQHQSFRAATRDPQPDARRFPGRSKTMDAKKRAEDIPEGERKAVWHALGELLHGKGGVTTQDTTDGDSGGNGPPPPPPGH